MNPGDSPCIKVCTLDPETGLCMGCHRTLDEIAAWGGLSQERRSAINAQLPSRRPRSTPGPEGRRHSSCAKCGAAFACGAHDRTRPCWCMDFPPVEPGAGAACLCPACLAAAAGLR